MALRVGSCERTQFKEGRQRIGVGGLCSGRQPGRVVLQGLLGARGLSVEDTAGEPVWLPRLALTATMAGWSARAVCLQPSRATWEGASQPLGCSSHAGEPSGPGTGRGGGECGRCCGGHCFTRWASSSVTFWRGCFCNVAL